MALVIRGETLCRLCGTTIEDGQSIIGFPAFLKPGHSLASYSDSAFHEECFVGSPDSDAVNRLYERYRQIWDSRPRDLKSVEEIEAWGKAAFREFG